MVHDLKRSYVLFLMFCRFADATRLHQLVKDGAKGTLPMKIDSEVDRQVVFVVEGEKVGSKATFTLAQYEFVDQGRQPVLHRQVQDGTPETVPTFYIVERTAQIVLRGHQETQHLRESGRGVLRRFTVHVRSGHRLVQDGHAAFEREAEALVDLAILGEQ